VLSGAAELKSRGAFIVGIGPEPDPIFDIHLAVPETGAAARSSTRCRPSCSATTRRYYGGMIPIDPATWPRA
jgi:hypothetical protein